MSMLATFDDVPKDDVIAIEPRARGRSDVELRRVRVGAVVRHGEHARSAVGVHEGLIVELTRASVD